jgi:two-component system chemotaxis sensor kinase CheA
VTSDDVVTELLGIFAAEAAEHIEVINRGLLAIEGADGAVSDELLQEVFRAAHSLKGAAGAVNLPQVAVLAHELEDTFAELQQTAAVPQPEVIQEAYHRLDAIETLVRAATAGGPERTSSEGNGQTSGGAPSVPSPPIAEDTVRVPTRKLDVLIAHVGELVVSRLGSEQRLAEVRALEASVARSEAMWRKALRGRSHGDGSEGDDVPDQSFARMKDTRRALAQIRGAFDADVRRLAQVTADLEADVRRARLLPLAKILDAFPRLVRDLAKETGKEIRLVVHGSETEVDRALLEQVKDPLLHLVRNSVEHGIEPPEERATSGKPRTGTITISVRQHGEILLVEVADDGTGIDVPRVRRQAVESGLLSGEAAAELPEKEAVSLILRAGLSTSPAVTELSGRGVGLDAVRDAAERLNGSVSLETDPGQGTVVRLSLPVTVSTMHAVLLEAGRQTFALPVAAVDRTLRVREQDVLPAQGREAVLVDGRPVVLVPLAEVLSLDETPGSEERLERPAVVVASHERRIALLADRVARTGEVVIKNLPEPLSGVRHIAGATILGTGDVALILSPGDLVASVERHEGEGAFRAGDVIRDRATILVVEDSVTTRTLEKNLLEAAGYSVVVAGDGLEAWGLLESGGCDLIVADVEMPRMDGFSLTARVRSDQRLRDLPVVLVTSRSTREDRERGVEAGADAYIVKGAFDQERLLDTIRRLL